MIWSLWVAFAIGKLEDHCRRDHRQSVQSFNFCATALYLCLICQQNKQRTRSGSIGCLDSYYFWWTAQVAARSGPGIILNRCHDMHARRVNRIDGDLIRSARPPDRKRRFLIVHGLISRDHRRQISECPLMNNVICRTLSEDRLFRMSLIYLVSKWATITVTVR